MKNSLKVLIMSFIVIVGLVGCGGGNTPKTGDNTPGGGVEKPQTKKLTVSFSISGIVRVNEPLVFTATSNQKDIMFYWGGSVNGNNKSINHVFISPEEYTVTLKVVNKNGETATATQKLVITPETADFSVSLGMAGDFVAGKSVTLTANAENGTAVSYAWSGDVTGNSSSITKTFTAGDHVVSVTVVDSAGNTATATQVITITESSGTGGLDPRIAKLEEGMTGANMITWAKIPIKTSHYDSGAKDDSVFNSTKAVFDSKQQKMVLKEMHVGHYFDSQKAGMMKTPTNEVVYGHTKVFYNSDPDRPAEYFNYYSSGLLSVLAYNAYSGVEEWGTYDSMIKFQVHSLDNGDYVSLDILFNKDWDGDDWRRYITAYIGIVYKTGISGEWTNTIMADHNVKKTYLPKYIVKENNHLGITKDTVLRDCIHSVNKSKGGQGPDRDLGYEVESVICKNIGLVYLTSKYIYNSEVLD